MGSSPLSRGIRGPGKECCCGRGSIPALAGNTLCAGAGSGVHGDHPRSRGEYSALFSLPVHHHGSSPLSRGIRSCGRVQNLCDRIIPALAGNTHPCRTHSLAAKDHPRSRGEYLGDHPASSHSSGSSPLSRGIPLSTFSRWHPHRIIPALAGNTMICPLSWGAATDHPRSRGEYCRCGRPHSGCRGSSPLSRGIQDVVDLEGSPIGIIPALAGNTWHRGWLRGSQGDHPRSRGEYLLIVSRSCAKPGSSPLSRGILRKATATRFHQGIIPALAGNTP